MELRDGGAMLNKKGVRVWRSKEIVMGGGFERASHVMSEGLDGC